MKKKLKWAKLHKFRNPFYIKAFRLVENAESGLFGPHLILLKKKLSITNYTNALYNIYLFDFIDLNMNLLKIILVDSYTSIILIKEVYPC